MLAYRCRSYQPLSAPVENTRIQLNCLKWYGSQFLRLLIQLHGPCGAVTGTDENGRDLTRLATWK